MTQYPTNTQHKAIIRTVLALGALILFVIGAGAPAAHGG